MPFKKPERVFRLGIVSDPQTGKTALACQVCIYLPGQDESQETWNDFSIVKFQLKYKQPTADVWHPPSYEQYCNHFTIDHQRCVFKTRIQKYPCSQSDGVVLVYDIANRASFAAIRGYHDQLRRDHEIVTQRANSTVRFERLPIVMVGNKADLVSDRTVPTEEGATLARELGCCGFLETSATQGGGGQHGHHRKDLF
ncbi:P-loop containing nucleoside triphosphate hydrolase protein [Lasiosphaeria ovina]|uniref:small monomeric GTPase n=1 Tax=Lasiosphaeria ovina TaxID=92902 RepID=A0AAE0KGG4_9PEZI|nr:P-loop containing nucleoside triphosphate hydrolase protein [Lasiosphaeria ovina]